jgi:Fe-S-cluster containining protein
VGEACGPISSSPTEIAQWQALGREDLLYFTLPDSCDVTHRAHRLHFDACPFLRFPEPGSGLCLIHPVKPLICREFLCAR